MKWLRFSVFVILSLCLTGCEGKPDCTNSIPLVSYENDGDPLVQPRVVVRELTRSNPAAYSLAIHVGDPANPQQVSVVPDTGSSALVLQGKDCIGCFANTRYAPSGLATVLPGTAQLIYGSGQAEVQRVQDHICWPKTDVAFPMEFNVMTKSEHLPSVLGLAYASLLEPVKFETVADQNPLTHTFLGELFNHAQLPRRFSLLLCGLCGGSRFIVGDETATGRIHHSDVRQWTSVTKQAYYSVPAQSLWWVTGNKRRKLGDFFDSRLSDDHRDRVILDSGSTFLVLPPHMASNLARLLSRIATKNRMVLPKGFWGVQRGSPAVLVKQRHLDLSQFPDLEIVLSGGNFVDSTIAVHRSDGTITLRIKPQQYLQEMKKGKRAFAVRAGESLFILGLPLLESYLTIFDLENHTVGFADNENLCCSCGG